MRTRLRSGAAKEAFKLRAELVERSFALTLDRGGMRRAWLHSPPPELDHKLTPSKPYRSRARASRSGRSALSARQRLWR